jgi:GTP cyclohydrolase II
MVHAFESALDRREHVVLTYGDVGDGTDVLAHVHSQCLAGDVFRSVGCNCAGQCDDAMRRIAAEGRGAIAYVSRGDAAILTTRCAFAASEAPRHVVGVPRAAQCGPDHEEYGVAVQLLRQLSVRSIRLLSDDPVAAIAFETYGMLVAGRLPITTPSSVSAEARLAVPVRRRSSQRAGRFLRARRA